MDGGGSDAAGGGGGGGGAAGSSAVIRYETTAVGACGAGESGLLVRVRTYSHQRVEALLDGAIFASARVNPSLRIDSYANLTLEVSPSSGLTLRFRGVALLERAPLPPAWARAPLRRWRLSLHARNGEMSADHRVRSLRLTSALLSSQTTARVARPLGTEPLIATHQSARDRTEKRPPRRRALTTTSPRRLPLAGEGTGGLWEREWRPLRLFQDAAVQARPHLSTARAYGGSIVWRGERQLATADSNCSAAWRRLQTLCGGPSFVSSSLVTCVLRAPAKSHASQQVAPPRRAARHG